MVEFQFQLTCPNRDVECLAVGIVYRFFFQASWQAILKTIACNLQEMQIVCTNKRHPYLMDPVRFKVHLDVDLMEGTSILYKFLEEEIFLQIVQPVRWELGRMGCYGCEFVQVWT